MENQMSHQQIFSRLIPDQWPPNHQIPTQIFISFFKAILNITLLYPVNIIIIILFILLFIKSILDCFCKPQSKEYWPRAHSNEQQGQIGIIKKDLREVKNEMVGIERKIGMKMKEKAAEKVVEKEEIDLGEKNEEIEELLQEGEAIEELSIRLEEEVKKSLQQMLHSVKKITN